MLSAAPKLRIYAAYAIMLAVAVALFFAIRWYGEKLTAPEPATAEVEASKEAPQSIAHPLLHVLVALAAVVVCGRVLGKLLTFVGQPPVIGEVLAGILLGPSLLGHEISGMILPHAVAPYLQVIAQLGVVLYMFLVGLELNADLLRDKAHATVAISHASIVAPFLLGAGLALYLYPRLSSHDVPFTAFSLFLGVSMSVTAFPVLARILSDRKMTTTPLGVVALTCAATDDVTAWCLLALVVGVTQAHVEGVFQIFALSIGYIILMFAVVRPIVGRLVARLGDGPPKAGAIAVAFAGVLLSALTTEAIGIHAIFGAFIAGAIIHHDSPLARHLIHTLEEVVTILLLPAFFAFTGMRTEIGLVSGVEAWLLCGLVILVATAGKFGGTILAARLAGVNWRDSAALGILMNTRGLMELIVLNIGLDLKVISPTLFAMLVIMALVTTAATTPVLHLLRLPKEAAAS